MPPAPALFYVTASQMNAWEEGQADDANPAQITGQTQLIQSASFIQSPVLSSLEVDDFENIASKNNEVRIF